MNRIQYARRYAAAPQAWLVLLILALPAAGAPLQPAYNWVSIWSNSQPQNGYSTTATSGRLFNPANPADPAAPIAHVTVTYYQYGCWGTAAATESQAIPPGQYGSFLTLLAAYPDVLYGTGCLLIHSDAPISPINGRIEETTGNPAIQTLTRRAARTEFWRLGQAGRPAWASFWEHSTPLGGAQFGGRFTGAYVLYTARKKKRSDPPVPPAHVTVTHFIGACGSSTVWKQESFELGSGAFRGYSSLPTTAALTGQGCVTVTSDQPVVAFNGAIYDVVYNPATGEQKQSQVAMTFQPIAWSAPGP